MAGLLTNLPAEIAGALSQALASRVRCHASLRARRLSLRVDAARGIVVLVLPPRAGMRSATAFLKSNVGWIERQLAAVPAGAPLSDGQTFSIMDRRLRIRHDPAARAGVRHEDDLLIVSGDAAHVPRRVRDWIKDQARRHLGETARQYAARLDKTVKKIVIRDTRTRWGSCSRDGVVSLSWRLVLAPTHVARYVVAHEVAHLKHMNHGPAFWRTVDQLIDDAKVARRWLRANGLALHRFGQSLS